MIVFEWIVQGFFFGIGIAASAVAIEFVTKRLIPKVWRWFKESVYGEIG
jgi:hypothetical protein